MNSVEIRVVGNGYMTLPGYAYDRNGMLMNGDEVRVFETFEGLTEWLKQNLKKPSESPPAEKREG